MLHHHPLAQALPPHLGLVMGARLLLEPLFGLNRNRTGALPFHAARSEGTGLTIGRRKSEASPAAFPSGAIIARRLPRRATCFHPVQVNRKLTLGETISVLTSRHLGRQRAFGLRKGAARRPSPISAIAHRFLHLRLHHPLALLH